MKFHLSVKSSNRKTGGIPVSTSPQGTCPSACPLREKGCYANGGPLKLHWDKVSSGERGTTWAQFIHTIQALPDGQVWRHNQAGDLVGKKDYIDNLKAMDLAAANKGKRGFTYTHYPVEGSWSASEYNRRMVRFLNNEGFIVNLSAEGLEHADKLADLEIAPVTTTLPSNFEGRSFKTPAGRKGIVCPAITRESMTCAKCKLCAVPLSERKYIIGFPAHGSQKKQVDSILEG